MEGTGWSGRSPPFRLLLETLWCHTLDPVAGAGATLSLGTLVGAGNGVGEVQRVCDGDPLPPRRLR